MNLTNHCRGPHLRRERSFGIFSTSLPQLAASYVRELENRLAQVERLIREVRFDTLLLVLTDGLNTKSCPIPIAESRSPCENLNKLRRNKELLLIPLRVWDRPTRLYR